MVVYCCAFNCKELFKKGGPVTFHSFPKDPERRKLWEVKIKRVNFKATQHSKICSKHFTPGSFDSTKFGGTWLKPDAVPSIFDFGENSKGETTKMPNPRKPPVKRRISPDESLHEAQKLLQISKVEVSNCKQTIRKLRQENKHLKKRVASLNGMLSELKEKKMISDDASAVLKLSLPGAAAEFINRLEMPNSKEKYPPELKDFALTFNFYSTKAYNYVRKTFECNLPHPTTLRKWYQSINGSPGFTGEAFSSLKVKAEEAEKKSTTIKCALMVDEIAIKKHVEWDRTKFSGYIDLGTDLDDDELPIAKEALVF
ncbi:DNA transposase THAP9 [Araneus ventricosus]|uniref:DNA transposase THAP9 n=1 Tax=Araneus ventricosus TaxID=182803 RepID=A0A4Y2NC03_ARAVE|nr:DNA transposase THAP9 [Araneus ventricosus]